MDVWDWHTPTSFIVDLIRLLLHHTSTSLGLNPRELWHLQTRFLEDAELVVIVIDYNVIDRSLFDSSFATWSILELSMLTIMTVKGYWGTLTSPSISFNAKNVFLRQEFISYFYPHCNCFFSNASWIFLALIFKNIV